MSDPSKVLLFGSFTEDETRTLLTQTPVNTQKPRKKNETQVSSSKVNPELTFGSFSTVSKSNIPVVLPNVPSNSHISDTQKANKKTSGEQFPVVEENGKVPNSDACCNNGKPMVKAVNFRELFISENDSVKVNGTANNPLVESHNNRDILARGLINSGNLCFLNATVQALLPCTPFVQLLQCLRNRNIPKVDYPTLAAFTEFISEFDVPGGAHLKKKESSVLETGSSFSPTMFEIVLRNFTPDVPSSISGRPRQEDAQEFLSFILDQMHDEFLKLEGNSNSDGRNPSLISISEDDEWETVGPKNTSAVTRTQKFVPSELSAIFGGHMKSVVKAKGNKASATVQPFFLLHLDISHEAIRTIENALHSFSASETLEEYRASSTGKSGVVSARKSVHLESLPKILILHLMRFGYGSHGSTKLHKAVHFPLELVLSRDLLVSSSAEGRRYELVSTITHHGREASKGHYTCDARYPKGQWLRFDDASVNAISTAKVLHDQAYVLIYKQL